MDKYPPDSYYLKRMKIILDGYPQHSPPIHPTKLTEQLYIGNQDNADDVLLLQNLEITHVLNCAGTRNFDLTRSPYPQSSGIKAFLMIPAQDYDEFNIMEYFEDAIGFLDSATLSNGRAFVHCSIGVNRSGAIVAAYLMISQRKKLLDVIVELKAKRLLILCNMGFRKQLVQFARANDLLDEVNETSENANRNLPEVNSGNQKLEETNMNNQNSERVAVTTPPTNVHTIGAKEIDVSSANKSKDENISLSHSTTDKQSNQSNNAVTQKSSFIDSGKSYSTRVYPQTNYKYKSTFKPSVYNLRHAEPDVIIKALNESYEKYKDSCKYKDIKSITEINKIANIRPSPVSRSAQSPARSYVNDNNKLLLYRQNLNYRKKSADRELANEVKEFLDTDKSIVNNQTDLGNLLDTLISKEDENIIWGKVSAEKDKNYINLQNKLDVLRSVFSDEQSENPKSALLTKQLKNIQHKEFVSEIQNLTNQSPGRKTTIVTKTTPTTPKTNKTTAAVKSDSKPPPPKPPVPSSKKHNFELDEEIENYMSTKYTPYIPKTSKILIKSDKQTTNKKSDDEVLKKISLMKSTKDIKPMSYYRLQVMSEKKRREDSEDKEQDKAFDGFSSTTSSSSSFSNEKSSSPLSAVNDSSYRSSISNIHLKRPIFKSRFLKSN